MIHQVPTMFIGIGGIGCQIAASISDMLDDEARKRVSVIGIDTDIKSLGERRKEDHKMHLIQISEDWSVNDFLTAHPEHEEWFPEDNMLRLRKMLKGAGQVRALSRLTFVAAAHSGKFNPIFTEINRIRRVAADLLDPSVVVIIVGSITGGTGAGMFIELPLFIRDNIEVKCSVSSCTIRGMFVGPDITEDLQTKKFMKDNVCVNGYACLKELNAFNIHHIPQPDMPDEIAHSLKLENYDSEDMSPENVPYDYLYLYEKTARVGTIGQAKLAEIIDYVSHIAYNLLFTPVESNAASIEDNFILESIRKRQMDRYVGAGICRLVFPVDKAQEFVTLSLVNELVEKEWLLLDKRYISQHHLALERRETDPNVKEPVLSKVYVDEFIKETVGNEGVKLLAKYADEAFYVRDDKHKSKADSFLDQIDKRVDDLMESDEVTRAAAACIPEEKNLTQFNLAAGEVDRVWSNLRKFVELAERLKSEKPTSYADDYFPIGKEAMLLQKDSPLCIYGYLATVHPIVARFLIYDLINKLEAKIEELVDDLRDVNLSAYKEEDFDLKTKGVQNPAEALSAIKEGYNPLWRKLGFIGDMIHSEEDALTTLRTKLKAVASSHVQTVKDYIENSVKCAMMKTILERLRQLSEEYEAFFRTIGKKLDDNNRRMENIIAYTFRYGEDGVYCTAEAYKRMYEEFKAQKSRALSLQEDTKRAIFEELFFIQTIDNDSKAGGITETLSEKDKRIQEAKKAMEAVFDTAIVATVLHNVVQNGTGIVNLTIKEALEKEYAISGKKNSTLNEYINERVNAALRIASPMLMTTAADDQQEELVFMATSPDNTIDGDEVSTLTYYLSGYGDLAENDKVRALIDDDFRSDELTFIKISYGHVIEDLVKYGPNSRNFAAYQERIGNLDYNDMTSDDEVNPHLNRYWHEEGFVPAMQSKQRMQDKKDLVRAFLFGLGFDCFIKMPYKDKVDVNGKRVFKWAETVGATLPQYISKNGQLIDNDFVDLYNSILFNGAIKRRVLRFATKKIDEYKGYNSQQMIADGLLENEFVKDLIRPDASKTGPAEKNILDIFLDMFGMMKSAEWENLVIGLRNLLWEVLEKLFNKNAQLIDAKTKEILKSIYDHSLLSSVSPDDYTEGQMVLDRLFKTVAAEDYDDPSRR